MNNVILDNVRFILKRQMYLEPGESLVIVAEDRSRSRYLSEIFMDLANSMGVEAVVTTMKMRRHFGDEPPKAVAAALKEADAILLVSDNYDITHTTASQKAREAGKRFYAIWTEQAEEYLRNPISLEGVTEIEERCEKFCKILDKAERVRLTTPYGTDLSFSIKGRTGRRVSSREMFAVPDYGEAAVIPVEGTAEGILVIDSSVQGWGYTLKKPIRAEVKKGRVQVETVSSEVVEEAERLKRTLLLDENANNFGELGLGLSSLIPKTLTGAVRDYGVEGTVHIACGRNIDIGGQTWSTVHQDVLMTGATVRIDDRCIIENGELKV